MIAIELQRFRNLTADMDILVIKQGEIHEAVEFTDKMLVFQVPVHKLPTGSLVSLDCVLKMPGAVEFPITGKVSFCEGPGADKLMRVGIELRQYKKDLWVQFLQKATADQNRVDHLLKSMKGE
jgi:hypothetical protein